MTTLELIAFLEHLRDMGALQEYVDPSHYERIALEFQKQQNKDHWTDKFFTPSTPEK